MKTLLCMATALVTLLSPVSGVLAAPPVSPDYVLTAKKAPPAAQPSKAKPAAPAASAQSGNGIGIDNDCRAKAPGIFNSVHEYTCAFQIIRAFSMPLADAAKRAEFERQFAPSVWLNSDYLKMDGVSEADRIKNTFALIRRARDFTHERFDFVHDAAEAATIDKESRHPVLDGGIGAVLRLNNMWQIQKAIFDGAPKDGMTRKEYMEKMSALALIGPGHELIIDATVRQGPADGVLKAGDIVTDIGTYCKPDGCTDPIVWTPVAGMGQDAAIKMIRGDLGTSVGLKVLRKNSAGKLIPLTLTLTRDAVRQSAITIHDVDGIRHIEISDFSNDGLIDDFYDAITGAEKANMKGIDINVRGNPGGRLDYVTAMLEMLVPRGLILKQVSRDPGTDGLTQVDTTMADGYAIISAKKASDSDANRQIQAVERVKYDPSYARAAARNPSFVEGHPLLPVISADMPITVEINVGSYSASEIFAGALQATHRAVIVGQGSAGKGAIMPEIPLPEGGSVDITNGQFYPGGMDTKHKGIIPDKIVDQAEDYGKTDAQRDVADATLREMYAHIQAVRAIEAERTKINDARFEAEMAARDKADLLPLNKLDPNEEQ
ncbi:MAG TPA: S41 family peptidase [Drouetiella sp.]|jgi:C-terminal processing protease CtpA/Prc